MEIMEFMGNQDGKWKETTTSFFSRASKREREVCIKRKSHTKNLDLKQRNRQRMRK